MRAVPLPEIEKKEEIKLDEISSDINIEDFSVKAAEIGTDAISGKNGPAKDTLIYTGALTLSIIKNIDFKDPNIFGFEIFLKNSVVLKTKLLSILI